VLFRSGLAPAEARPFLDGPVQLADAESAQTLSFDLTPERLEAYRAAVDAHIENLRRTAHAHGMTHRLHLSDVPLETAVLAWICANSFLR
jgi:pyrroloquinoline quinone (PQQ) biosynthesis protein C